jgi:toxin ParE1/3/4
MKVVWTDTAQEHLASIHAYIARDSPAYALRMIDRLTQRSQQIAHAPLSGRRVPEFDLDQLREVIEGSYRMLYHIKHDQISVIAVIHGAREVLRTTHEVPPPTEGEA